MRFALATTDDFAAVVEIMNHAIEEQRNAYLETLVDEHAAVWFQKLSSAGLLLLAKEGSETLAWGSLSDYRSGRGALSKVAEVSFYVHRSHRGKGVGKALLAELEQEAMAFGLNHLLAILLDNNRASRTMLEKAGYLEWGNFKGIAQFPEHSCGHLYMGKHLQMTE